MKSNTSKWEKIIEDSKKRMAEFRANISENIKEINNNINTFNDTNAEWVKKNAEWVKKNENTHNCKECGHRFVLNKPISFFVYKDKASFSSADYCTECWGKILRMGMDNWE